MDSHILERLYEVLQARKNADPESSYVASLYSKGSVKISEKIREEAEETIVEGLRLEKSSGDDAIRKALREESADLLFHLMVLLAHHNIAPDGFLTCWRRGLVCRVMMKKQVGEIK